MPDYDINVYTLDVDFEAFSQADAEQQAEAAKAALRTIKGSRLALFSEAGDYDDYDDDERRRTRGEPPEDLVDELALVLEDAEDEAEWARRREAVLERYDQWNRAK